MSNFRFTDDLVMRAADMPAPIHTVETLLRVLHVTDSSATDQRQAIAAWLTGNVPSSTLRLSLEHSRFSGLLGSAAVA